MRKSTRRPVIFRHSVNADWGHGIIVEENPSKVYVYFENKGRRPFLNDPRYRQLLVVVDLPSAEADALVAMIEKRAGPLPRAAARKRKAPAKSAVVAEHPGAAVLHPVPAQPSDASTPSAVATPALARSPARANEPSGAAFRAWRTRRG